MVGSPGMRKRFLRSAPLARNSALAKEASGSLGDADHADRDARAGVAAGLGGEVVLLLVHDHPSAEDGVFAAEADPLRGDLDVRLALGVGSDVAEVAGVVLLGVRRAVLVALGIEVRA